MSLKDPPRQFVSGQPYLQRDGWLNSLGFEEIANFRDVAGIDPSVPPMPVRGGRLRRGLLYRASQLQFATPSDIALLRDSLQIRTYIDLRSDEGFAETRDADVYDTFPPSPIRRKGQPRPEKPGERRRVSCPLLRGLHLRKLTDAEKAGNQDAQRDTWYQLALRDPATGRVRKPRRQSPAEMAADLEQSLSLNNKAMLLLNGSLLNQALQLLAQRENYPVVFGCMTGKDRTGLISCLVLGCLGASDEDIIADFMLSQAAVKHNGLLADRNFRLAMKEHPEAFKGVFLPAAGDPKNQVLASVFPSIMVNTLGVIREQGGFEAFLSSIGFGPEQQSLLRSILVEPELSSRL